MRNLTTVLPLKFRLSGQVQRFNATDGSIEMLNIFQHFDTSICSIKTFQKFKLNWKLVKHITRPKQ